jgi:hypothetical protein
LAMMLVYLTRFQLHAPVQIRKLRLRGTKIKNSKEVNEKDPEIESSFLFLGLSFNRNNACDGPSKIKYSKEQIKRKKRQVLTMTSIMMRMILSCVVLLLAAPIASAWAPQQQQQHSKSRSSALTTLWAESNGSPNNSNSNNNNNGGGSKFSQPAFAQPAFRQAAHPPKQRRQPSPQKSSQSEQPGQPQPQPQQQQKNRSLQRGGDSTIGIAHAARVRAAGRVGTKRYVNPCKVFFGNLPFDYTEANLQTWICDKMGMPFQILLNDCKIVRDWKTGNSKGFGFAVFTEAVYATVCIDKCHRVMLEGRAVTVKQGAKKQETIVYLKKNKKASQNPEEAAILNGIEQASDGNDDNDNDDDDNTTSYSEKSRRREREEIYDPYELAILRKLDPDLVDDRLDDADLFAEFADSDGDDDNDGVDGVWVEDNGPVVDVDDAMNRQTRREASRRQKRIKLPHKGFEKPVEQGKKKQ